MLFILIFFVSCSNKKIENKDINLNSNSNNKIETLKIAFSTEPDSFDPYLSAAADTKSIMKNVFDGLVRLESDGSINGAIAKLWEISEDGLEYKFYLNEGVHFHNGKELTSEDVIYSYKRLLNTNSKFSNIENIEMLDKYLVKIILKKKDTSFIYRVTEAILPNKYEDHKDLPIGTGPYKFISYKPMEKLILEKFENYYDKNNMPKINKVEFLFIPNDNAKILALKSNDVHIFTASKDVINQLSEKEFDKYSYPSNITQLLVVNNNVKPFDNLNVRKALNFAINREIISNITTCGEGKPLYTIISPATQFWYNKDTEKFYFYNRNKAIEFLKLGGYQEGFDMEITVPSNYMIHVNTAQIIAEQLAEIGINVKIKQVEWATWLDEIYEKHNYESTLVGLVGKADPHESLVRYYSDYPKNFFEYKNKEYDKYIEDALLESDIKKRREIYNKAQVILTKDAASIFLQDPGIDLISIKNLKGYVQYPVPFWDLSKFYFD